LTGIYLNAIALERNLDAIPAQDAPLILNIARSTELMTAFVQEFLANQSVDRIQIEVEPFDLRAVLEEVAERYAVVAGAKKITLVVELPEHPIRACAAEEALALALDNLLSNAIKFSPIERTVTLTAGTGPQEWVHITIRDEGPGFIAEDQEKMFRRYARLSAWPTSGEPSTGLGLFIVKRLVEAMNGHITVKSEEGAGACITVRLPAAG
jgi:two-component system sensor histidine kinase/response regulator